MMVTGMFPSTCKLAKLFKSLLMQLAWLKAGNMKWYKYVTRHLFFHSEEQTEIFFHPKRTGIIFPFKKKNKLKTN
jgi:hypothetical protein